MSDRRMETPAWVRYVAIDSHGNAWAFEATPEIVGGSYHARAGTRYCSLGTHNGGLPLSEASVARLVFPFTESTE